MPNRPCVLCAPSSCRCNMLHLQFSFLQTPRLPLIVFSYSYKRLRCYKITANRKMLVRVSAYLYCAFKTSSRSASLNPTRTKSSPTRSGSVTSIPSEASRRSISSLLVPGSLFFGSEQTAGIETSSAADRCACAMPPVRLHQKGLSSF